MRFPFVALGVALLLAGCGAPPPDTPGQTGRVLGDAPWWDVGDFWLITLQRADGSSEDFRMVNFWNDSDSSHFWLGVKDRDQARDMALHDDNPFLGRIHWGIFTPHERGIHAHGMYTFPVRVGDRFGGLAFERDWAIAVENGTREGQLVFKGTSGDRATLEYDYLEANQWWSYVDIKEANGARFLRADVKEHGSGEKGTFFFLRGRDYATIEDPAGTREASFAVEDEGLRSLAVEFTGTLSGGPLTVTLRDASGGIAHTEVLQPGKVDKIVEIAAPATGDWKAQFAGAGTLDGHIELTGILEYTRTL